MTDLCFYLGVPEGNWLSRTEVPLCVSYGRLRRIKGTLPRSPKNGHWFLDSRGFSELKDHGRWTITPREYFDAVCRYDEEIGNLGWASIQDWMCEPAVIHGGVWNGLRFAGTGLSIEEHQRRTVANFLELSGLWRELDALGDNPFMPVLQGWSIEDYHRCWDMYEEAGVRISEHYPIVCVGSVCRRQDTEEIAAILRSLRERDPDLPAHGFGVKQGGLLRGAWNSADSQAWSINARYGPKDTACTAGHRNCANCLTYALSWRERLLAKLDAGPPEQLDLFADEEAAA